MNGITLELPVKLELIFLFLDWYILFLCTLDEWVILLNYTVIPIDDACCIQKVLNFWYKKE